MKIRTAAALSLLAFALSAGPLWAGAVGVARTFNPEERDLVLAQLQSRKLELGRQRPATPKGVPLLRWNEQRTRLQEVIDRVNREVPVSQDEVDRVLQ